jgi:hypothetical protein
MFRTSQRLSQRWRCPLGATQWPDPVSEDGVASTAAQALVPKALRVHKREHLYTKNTMNQLSIIHITAQIRSLDGTNGYHQMNSLKGWGPTKARFTSVIIFFICDAQNE